MASKVPLASARVSATPTSTRVTWTVAASVSAMARERASTATLTAPRAPDVELVSSVTPVAMARTVASILALPTETVTPTSSTSTASPLAFTGSPPSSHSGPLTPISEEAP